VRCATNQPIPTNPNQTTKPMKRPILKRTIRTVEIVTWTLAYEDVPEEDVPIPNSTGVTPESSTSDHSENTPAEQTAKVENREIIPPSRLQEEVQLLDKS
jgi:hypothetical protein